MVEVRLPLWGMGVRDSFLIHRKHSPPQPQAGSVEAL